MMTPGRFRIIAEVAEHGLMELNLGPEHDKRLRANEAVDRVLPEIAQMFQDWDVNTRLGWAVLLIGIANSLDGDEPA